MIKLSLRRLSHVHGRSFTGQPARQGRCRMTATKLFPSGAWEISDIIGGYLVRHVYYGYIKREALAAFKLITA